jgi:hypothetical protein
MNKTKLMWVLKKVGVWISGITAAVASTVVATVIINKYLQEDPTKTTGKRSDNQSIVSTANWSSKGGYWKGADDKLYGEGGANYAKYFYNQNYTDFVYEVKLRKLSPVDGAVGLLFRYDEKRDEGYLLLIFPDGSSEISQLHGQSKKDAKAIFPSSSLPHKKDQWTNIKIIGNGAKFRIFYNGQEGMDFVDDKYAFGRLGLVIHGGPEQKAEFIIISRNES